jgi:acetylornithine/succinyldiaminopimelate/putrescine aminotransferase
MHVTAFFMFCDVFCITVSHGVCTSLLLQVLVEEKLADRAQHLGELFRQQLRGIKSERVKTVRGRGMLNALVIQVRCARHAAL